MVELTSCSGRVVIAAAVFGTALAYMSDDMLNVALPTLADDLEVGVTGAQPVVNGYFVTRTRALDSCRSRAVVDARSAA